MKAIILFIAALATIASTQTEPMLVYVKSADTDVLSKPSGKSETLYTAKAGETLKVLDEDGKYYRVKTTKDIVGYVFKLRVTSEKPGSASDESSDILFGEKKIGKRSSAMDEGSSSHSIRGREKDPSAKKK